MRFVSAANAVQVVIIGLPLTAFFARISRNQALAVASLMLGVGLGLYSWMHSLAGYEIGVLIWTCGEIVYYPLSTALPSHLRGVYQGIFGTMTGVSYLIAPALGGAIMQYLGAAVLWRICLVTGLFIACAYLVLGKVQQILKQSQIHKQGVTRLAIGEACGND